MNCMKCRNYTIPIDIKGICAIIVTTNKSLIQSGGGNGPMKPGNRHECAMVLIPTGFHLGDKVLIRHRPLFLDGGFLL